MEHKNLDTPSLISKCVERDPLAWAEFAARFSPILTFAIKKSLGAYSAINAGDEAKDILQGLLMSLWNENKLANIKNTKTINYWLAVTARNASMDYLRKKKNDPVIRDCSYFEDLAAKNPEPEEAPWYLKDADETLKRMHELLTSKQRLMLKLYFKKGLSSTDIARMLGVSAGNVTATIARIRKKIRSKM